MESFFPNSLTLFLKPVLVRTELLCSYFHLSIVIHNRKKCKYNIYWLFVQDVDFCSLSYIFLGLICIDYPTERGCHVCLKHWTLNRRQWCNLLSLFIAAVVFEVTVWKTITIRLEYYQKITYGSGFLSFKIPVQTNHPTSALESSSFKQLHFNWMLPEIHFDILKGA